MKKTVAFLLAFVLILAELPFAAISSFAETSTDGKYDYYVSDNKATIVKYNKQSDTGTFTVPSKIGSYPVTAIEDFCFSQCSLESVTIPNSVVSVGDVAFEKCKKLTTVYFGAGMKNFGTNVFSETPSLASINVSNANPYFKSIDGVLYSKDETIIYSYPVAKKDTDFVVPNKVKSVEHYAFDGAINLKTITIGTGLTAISDLAFIGAFNVERISILGAVTYIGNNAFGNINKLTSINIPDTVTYIGKEAFQDDNALKTLLIPSSVSYIGVDAFEATDPNFLMYCYSESYAVSYCETYNIEYELVDSVLSSVAITSPPTTTQYCRDMPLDTAGLLVSAVYSNGISRTVTGYSLSDFDASTLGAKAVTVSYTDGGVTRSAAFTIEIIEHQWEKTGAVDGSEPTCLEEGLDLYTCSVCGAQKQEASPALGHLLIEDLWEEPTCTESGFKDIVCDRCGELIEMNVEVPPLGHISENYIRYQEATCTQAGVASGICTRCGEEFDDVVAPLGHQYQNSVIEATCTSGGVEITSCTRCGVITSFLLTDKLEHNYTATVTQPDCTGEGYTTYVCKNCNNTYIANRVNALGHQYTVEKMQATCTQAGYTYHHCERCSHVYYSLFTQAAGHSFEEKTVNPTSVKMGYTLYTCRYCQYAYYGNIQEPTGPTSVIASCADTVEVGKSIKITTDLTPSGIVDRISFSSSNKKIATVSANGTVTGKSVGTVKIKCYVSNGKYKTLTVKVKTPSTQINKLISVAKGRLKVTWKQVDYADGYCVQYSTDKNFKKNTSKKYIAGKKNTSVTFKSLKSGKTYYVKVSAYKNVSGQKSLSNASKVKSLKLK